MKTTQPAENKVDTGKTQTLPTPCSQMLSKLYIAIKHGLPFNQICNQM